MKHGPYDRGRLWGLTLAAVLWTAAFCLACRAPSLQLDSGSMGQPSVTGKLTGGCRVDLGRRLYETADLYFHKGVPHSTEEALAGSAFKSLARHMAPRDHMHAEGQDIQEMMPWLWLSIKCDPHNMETYLVAAFWLAGAVGQVDLALDVLREAQHNNPGDYRPHLERGRILLAENRLAEARAALDVGIAFWPGKQSSDSEDALFDLRNLLLHRSLLYELDGDLSGAVSALERILKMFPGSAEIETRATLLAGGGKPEAPAGDVLRLLLSETARQRSRCQREDHEQTEHGHECGPTCKHDVKAEAR